MLENIHIQGSSCLGMECQHDGVVTYSEDGNCKCSCPAGKTGIFCEYVISRSSFPNGPYALPMSKYGCPEGPEQGWHTGYINLTSKHSFRDVNSYPEKFHDFVKDIQKTFKWDNSLTRTNILGPFDSYTLQLNFCYKLNITDAISATAWFDGIYGVFGSSDGCPMGLKEYPLVLYLPTLLHYNIDGHVPHFELRSFVGGEELHFTYCRHVIGDDVETVNSMFPYMVIKDPLETDSRCQKYDGYNVNIETFPEPLPAIIQTGSDNANNTDNIFQLRCCHVIPVSRDSRNLSNAYSFKYSLLFSMNGGFPGLAFNFLDILTENYPCENQTHCNYQPISKCSFFGCGIVQSWILIDIRREVLVSAIMISASDMAFYKFPVDITNIFVSNKLWGVFSDGALICSDIDDIKRFEFWHVRLCEKPHLGRYVTILTRPRSTHPNDIEHPSQRFVEGDAWQYTNTIISVLAFESYDVFALKRFEKIPVLNESITELSSTIKNLDIESVSCKQELGVQDYGIWDSQLSASSWQPLHLPSHVRPQYSGWCAAVSDQTPYLQVDLFYATLVDGFTIYNWFTLIDFKKDNVYMQDVERMGTSSFYVYYGTSLQTLKRSRRFTCDSSKEISEPETFILSEPLHAQYLRFFPKSFPESKMPCMKMEILGCRLSDFLSLTCQNNTSKGISRVDQIYVAADKPGKMYTNLTVNDCEQHCLKKEPGCISTYYVVNSSSCSLHFDNNNRRLSTMNRNSSSDVLSMVTCLVEEREQEVRIKGYWRLFKEHEITTYGFLTSFGYPLTYSYNSVNRWKLDLPSKSLIVRFLDISLRSFEEPEKTFPNTFLCRDSVILKAYPKYGGYMGDPYRDFNQVKDFDLYGAVTSDHNGQKPVFPMGHYPNHQMLSPKDLNVSEGELEFSRDASLFVIFYSCSSGTALNVGKGFRLHVSALERAICAEFHMPMTCVLTEMNIISNRFLGQEIVHNQKWQIYMKRELADSILMIIEILDFDISCHKESSLEISSEFGETSTYCNGNRPYGEMIYRTGIYTINHVHNILQSTFEDLFQEGFSLSYKCIPKDETLPPSLQITSGKNEGATFDSKACFDSLQKCFYVYMLEDFSWEDVYKMCKDTGKTIVNVKSIDEMAILKSILLDFTRNSEKHRIATEIFIGLQRYEDVLKRMYEFWTDGSPLSYTAWDKGQPADISINKCTKMGFIRPSVNDTWATQSCRLKMPKTLGVCEEIISDVIAYPVLPFNLSAIGSVFNQRDLSTVFKCSSGEWISSIAKCNQIVECLDASDESNCSNSELNSCKNDEFKCTDGRCIHISMVCDFREDCVDAVDEFCDNPSCSEDQFKCINGQCVRNIERCNSVENCFDGSDEMNCDECSSVNTFQCLDKSCIPSRLVCDMVKDCPDGSDELSCNRDMSTCELLLINGIRRSGYFQMDQGYFIYCDFENVTSGGDWIYMTIFNTDWKQLAYNKISISSKGAINAVLNGFECSQKLGVYPQRENEMASYLDGENVKTEEQEFVLELRMKILGKFLRHMDIRTNYTSFTIETDEKLDGRIKIWNIHCKKIVPRRDLAIHCRIGVAAVKKSFQCIYDIGWRDVILGCRSLAHLQNCASFTCPTDYIKCPESYCVPLKYVCNGKVDCPDGYDERMCGCENGEKSVIMVIPDNSQSIQITANQFAASLFANGSHIRILKSDFQSVQKSSFVRGGKIDMGTKVSFSRFDVLMNSQHIIQSFERISVKTADIWSFLSQLIAEAGKIYTSAIVWLIDDTSLVNETYSLMKQFGNLSLDNHFNYLLALDPQLRTNVVIKNDLFVNTIHLRNMDILRTIGDQLLPKTCFGGLAKCEGRYRCGLSKVCIPLGQICDGSEQCPHGDDEHNCDFKCPSSCSCHTLIINCSNLEDRVIDLNTYTPARILDVTNSPSICKDILENNETRSYFRSLISLVMSTCGIDYISKTSFDFSINLQVLDLSHNEIRVIPSYAFSSLKVLEILLLEGNSKLTSIESHAFYGTLISSLTIKGSKIETLKANIFFGLTLNTLDITRNNIKTIEDGAFNYLESKSIDISLNPIKDFTKEMFSGLTNVKRIRTPAFKFCCIRPSDLAEEDCYPHKDEFSSCEDLMRNSTLQALMWTIGILAFVGNVMSLIYRLIYDKKRLKLGYGIFVTNLALADLLMGAYMLVIAIADKIFRDRYIEVDEYWRNSAWCKMAGVISTVSSEASVLFMCLITVDRILIIKYPFGQIRFKERSATIAVSTIWVFVIFISLLPIAYTRYFKGQFYSKSGVCLALPLTRDRQAGWLYSILLFIGFNMITFIMIAIGQLLIYTEIKKASSVQKSLTTTRTNDLKVARNLLLVVTTDFLCWFPIGMMGCLALTGHVIPGEVYAWTAVFVLPVNSALNPFMYTLTAIYNSKNFTPSIDEQSRTDPMKEFGKAILEIYPYVPTRNLPGKFAVFSLSDWIDGSRLTVSDTTYLVYRILKFMTIAHGYNLVLRHLKGDNIYVVVLRKNNSLRRTYIDVQLFQGLSSYKKEMAEDINQFGCLLDKILNKGLLKTT